MSKRKVIAVLFLYSFILGGWLYYKGFKAGWEGYKHSKNILLALDSAYKFGLMDCQNNDCGEHSCYFLGVIDAWNQCNKIHGLTK